jgi:polar amino acid transport system substrate-binding protein
MLQVRRGGRPLARAAIGLMAPLALSGTASAGSVTLVTGHGAAPFVDPRLPDGGMAAAIVRAAYARVPTTLDDIAFTDGEGGEAAVQRGAYAGAFPYAKTAARREAMYYSDPLYVTTSYPAVNARTSLQIDRMNDLVGLTFCAPDDHSLPREVEQLEQQGKVFGTRPHELIACVRMLRRQRVDFVPAIAPVFRRTAEDAFGGSSAFRFTDLELQQRAMHVIFPRNRDGSKAALRMFNTGLARVKASGRWAEIVARYLP